MRKRLDLSGRRRAHTTRRTSRCPVVRKVPILPLRESRSTCTTGEHLGYTGWALRGGLAAPPFSRPARGQRYIGRAAVRFDPSGWGADIAEASRARPTPFSRRREACHRERHFGLGRASSYCDRRPVAAPFALSPALLLVSSSSPASQCRTATPCACRPPDTRPQELVVWAYSGADGQRARARHCSWAQSCP